MVKESTKKEAKDLLDAAIGPEDYVFVLCRINPQTGLYDVLGVTVEEKFVYEFMEKHLFVAVRVEIFAWDNWTGPIRTITSIEEFEEFMI